MANSIPKRDEVQKENTWATEDIFASDAAWEAAYAEAKQYPEKLAAYRGKLAKDGQALLAFLQENDEIGIKTAALYRYASLKSDEDTTQSKYTEMVGRAYSLYVEIGAATAFAVPELLTIDQADKERFMRENPSLAVYQRYLDLIEREKPHTLSEAEEKLLAMAGEIGRAPDDIASKLGDADLRFPDVMTDEGPEPLTHATFMLFMHDSDRAKRKDAFEKLYGVYQSFENTSAALLDAQVKQLIFFAKARNYDSTLQASLFRNEVPTEVYHNLIDTVHKNLPAMVKYTNLRKKALGVDELHMYDLYVPMVPSADVKIPFETAKENCIKALAPLGADYGAILKEGFDNRWIDVYENQGKRSGAYSSGCRPHPFVLLNYKETLDSEFTLIHEMGHALHSYLSKQNQPVVYADYVIFVAEVASTCNEVLLMKYLLANTEDKERRAYLINYFLEQFRTTVYRQTMFAEFEMKINEMGEQGATLTPQALNALYYDLNKQYYGADMVVDEQIAVEWARIPHFYYDFYVFQYATGFSAAVALAQRILEKGEPAAKQYLSFLSSGCKADPITLLKEAGVDMTSPAPIQSALTLFSELVDELDGLLS
ncbi:MAG: oligoendopeptidase F [Clostridiales bacterium]|nr:oligoendopeptidase F [Clostridiales bacterium]